MTDQPDVDYHTQTGLATVPVYPYPAYCNDDAFNTAWLHAVTIAGHRWFGTGTDPREIRHTGPPAATQTHTHTTLTKWDLAPRVDNIENQLGILSSGEAAFLAALVSLYNARTGSQLLTQIDCHGLADIASRLDEPRRRALADLLVAYPGW